MDILTLKKAQKYAKALVDTIEEEIGDIDEDLGELDESIKELASDAEIINADGDIGATLILFALRQLGWKVEADALICEQGTATLTNSQKFPFNDSQKSVALAKQQKNIKYAVLADVVSSVGNAGEIVASDLQVNGFKLAYTGSASSVVVKYIVIGGIIA